MEPATLNAMSAAAANGDQGVLIIEIATGRSRFLRAQAMGMGPIAKSAERSLATEQAFEEEVGGNRYFFKPLNFGR
ncbi:MAG: hypothetical protein AAFR27_14080 [Pseudomonadota bacterium]